MEESKLITLYNEKRSAFEKDEIYDNHFSDVDGFLFYDEFSKMGLIDFNKETKQCEWDSLRSDLSWYKKTMNNPKPTEAKMIQKAKANLFKDWFLNAWINGDKFEQNITK